MRQSVDITRLSRIAQHNLEREGEGADYSSAVGGAPAAEAQAGDIRIDSADAELDFEENREEGEPAAAAPACVNRLYRLASSHVQQQSVFRSAQSLNL